MTFFVTSVGPGKGGDLGGLEGADAHCQTLAQAAGAGTRPGAPISAPSRRGVTPSTRATASATARGRTSRASSSRRTSTTCTATTTSSTCRPRSPRGASVVKGRGDTPNMHDMLTGSQPDGRAFPRQHQRDLQQLDQQHPRQRAGRPPSTGRASPTPNSSSWNSSHMSRSCSQPRPGRHRRRRPVLLLRGAVARAPQRPSFLRRIAPKISE